MKGTSPHPTQVHVVKQPWEKLMRQLHMLLRFLLHSLFN